jgi:predicted RNA-binding protein with PUA domain
LFQGQDDLKGSFAKAVGDRWATIPVVKVAQAETVIDFPVELDSAWAPLQRHFGCAAESGNNTANVLYNFTPDGNRVFKINIGQSDEIVSSEEAFFRMFYDIEALVWNYDLVLHGVVLVTNYESRRVLSILTWLDCGI